MPRPVHALPSTFEWNLALDPKNSEPARSVTTMLLIEDGEDYAYLLSFRLKEAFPEVQISHARTVAEAISALSEATPSVILSDLTLPDSEGIGTVTAVRAAAPATPLVVLSGNDDDSVALEAVKIGAQDYLLKDEISERLLQQSILYAIERHHDKRALAKLAHQDVLTGLANRGLFQNQLSRALGRATKISKTRPQGAGDSMTILMFLDLDNFKVVNDEFGHDAGDSLLCAIAEALRGAVRHNDLVARFGGDEFAILLENVHDPQFAQEIATRILRDVESATVGSDGKVSTSVGIAVIRAGEASADTAMKRADMALYQAKNSGRNQSRFFDEALHSRMRKRRRTVSELTEAINKREFLFEFQPINDVSDASVIGAEALIRWNHPVRGRLAPAEFIELMEEERLLNELSSWAFDEICSTISGWRESGWTGYVGVNLSPRQFEDDQLVRLVDQTLCEHSLPAEHLQIEITENHLVNRTGTVMDSLNGMQELGIKLAIDDFGTGYSSLSYLRQLPVSSLKIDRSFVSTNNTVDVPIVRSIIQLAHALDFRVVAEGVETLDQLEILSNLDCDSFQGYFEAKPMKATEFLSRYCSVE